MEDSARGRRHLVLYAVSVFYWGLTVWSGIGSSQGVNNQEVLGYTAPAGFGLVAIFTLYAARKAYRGGLWFITGTVMTGLAVLFTSVVYDSYRRADSNAVTGGIGLAALLLMLAALLFWQGHRRHLRLTRGPDFEADESSPVANATGTTEFANPAPPLLYPPMQGWRVFLLMLFSATFYSLCLMYRIVKDLCELGETQLSPKRCAWQMLIPLYNFTVFLKVAERATRLARDNGITVKCSPRALMSIFIAAYLSSFMLPDFLFLLSASLVAIPWVILNQRMNNLRRVQVANWRETTDRYSWRQRAVLLAGTPVIVLALLGSKAEFSFYAADRLDAEQTVSGQPARYQLTIPDRQWRQVATGTLYPDTDLELLNKPLNEWVVVRVLPSQRQSLDSFVDQRKAVIAANWNSFEMEETRTFTDAELIPMSIVRYSQTGTLTSRDSPLFVATLVTADQVFEVIGHATNNPASSARDLVKSLRLINSEKKS